MRVNESIIRAINGKRLIKLVYSPGARVVEPHTYGINVHGNELLRAFQIRGASSSGERRGWKLFRLDRIASMAVLSDEFQGPRQGYVRGDRAMTQQIFAEL